MPNDPDFRTPPALPPLPWLLLLPLLDLAAVATASLTELGAVSSSAPAAAGRYLGTGYVEEGIPPAPSGGACGGCPAC